MPFILILFMPKAPVLYITEPKARKIYSFHEIVMKFNNLQYNTLGGWDNRVIDQGTDVPSIIFFHNFLQNSLQKSFSLLFITLQK